MYLVVGGFVVLVVCVSVYTIIDDRRSEKNGNQDGGKHQRGRQPNDQKN